MALSGKSLALMVSAVSLLAGCAVRSAGTAGTPPTIPASLTPQTTASPTSPPTCTSAPTATIVPTRTPTDTWTPTPSAVTQTCLELRDETSFEAVAKTGTVVILGADDQLVLLDLETGERYRLPLRNPDHPTLFSMAASPNRSALVYGEVGPNGERILWVVRANGEVVTNFPWKTEWSGTRWVNNEVLEFFYNYYFDNPISEGKVLGTVVHVNAFTGEVKEVPPAFPDPYDDPTQPPSWIVRYSPDLKQVIYLQDQYQNAPIAILWDLVLHEALWQSPNGLTLLGIAPKWSPAGDQVASIVDGNLYRVDRSGQEFPLPDFAYPSWTGVTGFDLSWSPDGRYLAFWMAIGKGYSARLLIMDTRIDRILDYCLESDYFDGLPLWSPDSQQFVIDSINDGQGGVSALLVKMAEKVGFPIPYSQVPPYTQVPDAWMKSIP
ncbi:MAG: hypothetical protein P8Y03_27425 [Anaerolineales bacterium]